MLNFLNPFILFALPAILIPIIIHFLNRTKRKEIPFSTIHFLKQMVHREIRKLRLRQILLMVVRIFLILFLILAFARPTLKSNFGPISGDTASEVVFIIDNSMSLNTLGFSGNLLDKTREWWFRLSSFFQSKDRISVIWGTKPFKVISDREKFSSEFWEKVYNEIQPTQLKGDLNSATLKAVEIFKRSHLAGKELYYISDFQKSGVDLDDLAVLGKQIDTDIRVFFLPVLPGKTQNMSVDSVIIVNQLLDKEQIVKLLVRLTNHNEDETLASLVSLVLKDNRVAQQDINLAPRVSQLFRFETVLKNSGFNGGFVQLENDDLLEDNRFYFNFFIPENIQILHVLPELTFESYIPYILKPAIDENIFFYQKVDLQNWRNVNFANQQVIVLEGINQFSFGFIDRLMQYLDQEGSLLIIPGDNIDVKNYNRLLHSAGIGQITSLKRHFGDENEFISLGKIYWDHVIFEGLFEDKGKLNPIFFKGYYLLNVSPESEPLIFLQDSSPFLVLSNAQAGNTTLITAPLQLDWSNIVIKGFVVPLIYRLIYFSAIQNIRDRLNLMIGKPFSITYKHLAPPYDFILQRPDGMRDKLTPIFQGNSIILNISDNFQLGNYQIWQANKLQTIYSVNHSPEESQLRFFNENEVSAIFNHASWINPEDNLTAKITSGRFGTELWPYLLGLIIILLIFEMILSYTGQAASAVPGESEMF
jgi:hypothetical protein